MLPSISSTSGLHQHDRVARRSLDADVVSRAEPEVLTRLKEAARGPSRSPPPPRDRSPDPLSTTTSSGASSRCLFIEATRFRSALAHSHVTTTIE